VAFSVNTNIASLQAQNYLRTSSDYQSKTINRVTSGLRIVSSGDDAAGLAIANGFRSDQAVLTQGIRNANDGLSTLQTIDGGMNNISQLLDRARTLATQSASSTFTGNRAVLNNEFQSVVTEIDRQAQAIGLDQGGQFAKTLSVFIGGGKANGTDAITNGSVAVDLTSSTVDSTSLGLSGMKAAGVSGTDISTSSTTSVESIVGNTANGTSGSTNFYFRGSGFAGSDEVKVNVNLSGVTDAATLVDAINTAIENAGNGTTAAATAFKNSGIKATIVSDVQSDGSVKQRLAFQSSNSAFQVAAGDQMSNALMGNFASGSTGKALNNSFIGGAIATAGTFAAATGNTIKIRISGGGLESPKDLSLSITPGTTTTAQALTALQSAVAADSDLAAAGITLDTATAGSALKFSSSRGEQISVSSVGDTMNNLGLGSFALGSNTGFDYTSITTSGFTAAAVAAKLNVSIGGGSEFELSFTAGASAAATVTAINDAISKEAKFAGSGITAVVAGAEITFASSNGTAFRIGSKAQGAALNLGLGATTAAAETVASADGLSNAVAGTATTVDAAGGETFKYTVAGGAEKTITLTDTANLAAAVAEISAGFTANGDTHMKAAVVNGVATIYTDDGSNYQITSGTANTLLGFTDNSKGLGTEATFNSGGAGNTAIGSTNDVISWRQIQLGSDAQNVTINATDDQGAQHSLAVTLENNGIARNARSLDEAINTINSALQASGDSTLKQVVAVKEQGDNGSEGVRFISKLQNFQVGLGAVGSSTANTEVGMYDSVATGLGQGVIETAEKSVGGGAADINTQESAKTAVTTLASAVTALGNAQAVVGKGQNVLNYATNLAQSQLTNLAAAESRIRDADLANEAANLSKAQILMQAGTAALAQANSAPQAILSLLRG
jgi:flagellin